MKQEKTVSRTILSSSIALILITGFVKILGYGEKRVLGHFFRTGEELDAFFTALKICLAVYFAFRGLLRPVVVPLLTSAKNESFAKARNLGFSLALWLSVLLGIAVVVGIPFAPQLVEWFASGFSAPTKQLAVRFTQWMFPLTILMTWIYLLTISLHVQKRFVTAALGECLQKVAYILALILWVAPAGFSWITWAYWLSFVFPFAFFSFSHFRRFPLFNQIALSGNGMGEMLFLAWPIAVGGIVSNLARLFQNNFASTLQSGSVSALTFAQTIIDLPLILVPFSISVVLLPFFSEFSDRRELERSTQYLARVTRLLLLLFVPAAIYVLLFRESIVHLLFKGGRFNQDSLRLTSDALAGLSLSLPFCALEMVFTTFFYAHKRMVVTMVAGIISTVLAVAALPLLRDHFSLAGIAAFLFIARAIKVALLLFCFRFIQVRVPWGRATLFLGKMLIPLLTALAFYLLASRFFFPMLPARLHSPIPSLLMGSVLLAGVYAFGLWAFRFPECKQTIEFLRNSAQKVLSPAKSRRDAGTENNKK